MTAVLVVMATYNEIYTETGKPMHESNGNITSMSDGHKYHELRPNPSNLPSVINDHIQVLPPQSIPNSDLTLLKRMVRCFNIRLNFQSIMSSYTPQTALPTINAFKSVGCIMILNFHLIWYSIYATNNTVEVFSYGEQLQWQWLSTAPLAVDIFFIIR